MTWRVNVLHVNNKIMLSTKATVIMNVQKVIQNWLMVYEYVLNVAFRIVQNVLKMIVSNV